MTDWTAHALEIAYLDESKRKILPPTDSLIRPDRYALEKLDIKKAAADKHMLEEKQRAEAKARKTPWQPRYFKKSETDENDYHFMKNYWEEREERIKKLNQQL